MLLFSLHESVSLSMKFDRTSILGSGGYGVGTGSEWNNKIVAVKRIEKTNCENNNKGEDALQKLHLPNVVKLYHVDSDIDFR
jgi:hypothetical protein